jgi:hypothetical protein
MNPYVVLGSGIGTSEAASLSARLATWHDAMVAHERALRARRQGVACADECPHVEARTLWAEAVATYGKRAQELAFLRSRATAATRPAPSTAEPASAQPEGTADARPSSRRTRMRTQDLPNRSVPSEPIDSHTGSRETWT